MLNKKGFLAYQAVGKVKSINGISANNNASFTASSEQKPANNNAGFIASSDQKPANNNAGFTFIEIMVVVMIIGILATFIVPKIINKPDEARVAKAKSEIKAIESGLKMYRMENSSYPTTEQGLDALFKKPDVEPIPRNWNKGGYIEANETPKDPWDSLYIYRSPGEDDRDYEIISLGADRQEGGEDVKSDIKSYEIR